MRIFLLALFTILGANLVIDLMDSNLVDVIVDSINHLGFDLTHESEVKGLGLWWGGLPSTS